MSAQPKTFMRPRGMTTTTDMSYMMAFADTIPILSTLSAQSLRHKGQLVLPLTQFVATLSRHLCWSHFVNLLPHKRLDKHECQASEEASFGLILCAESSREQVELLQMHKDGITVAECWAELPPKAEHEQHLHQALLEARERMARRGDLLKGGEDA